MLTNANTELMLPPAKNDLAETVTGLIESIRRPLHPSVSAQQFVTTLIVTINELDPSKITHPNSVVICAFNCAALGLLPGKQLGLAYFIPRKGKCNLEIGYRGYLDLAFRNDHLKMVYAECVFQGEPFEWYIDESGPKLHHTPDPDRDPTRARELTHLAYCIYETKHGGRSNRVLTRKQLNAVDSNEHVWKSNYYEMARKTPLRRCAKDWRCTLEMNYALDLDEAIELGRAQALLPGLKIEGDEHKTFSLDDLPEVEESEEGESDGS